MLYQCSYAARVREKVANVVSGRELGALSLLYQLNPSGRARIGLYVVLVQYPAVGANQSQSCAWTAAWTSGPANP